MDKAVERALDGEGLVWAAALSACYSSGELPDHLQHLFRIPLPKYIPLKTCLGKKFIWPNTFKK